MAKKRCLLWDYTNTADRPQAIEQLDFNGQISSVANWNAWVPPELKGRLPFRPTVRTLDQMTDETEWGFIYNSDHTHVHYLNEPERQSITPVQAAEMWKKKMVPLRKEKGKKLIGPGCASDEPGAAWLDEFMKRVEAMGEPPDYLGVHYYGENGKNAIEYIQQMHNKYPRYNVVVSELASISRNKAAVYAFTAQLANWMDETPWIFEYCFFGCMNDVADKFVSPEAQLMNPDGSFNPLMRRLMTDRPIRESLD